MKLFGRDLAREIAIVAECGVNHEGDPDVALALVDAAADAGADAVKFQTYTAERLAGTTDPERLARVKRFGLDADALRALAARAGDRGITFFSTPASDDVVPLLDELCPVFKIASGDIDFEPVIRATAATGKPLVISTGAATTDEIATALDWIRDETGNDDLRDRALLLHCVSAYPTPIEEANLLSIPFLAERFGLTTGYSNHVMGAEASLAAVALGARAVEVHFTDRKEDREFRDHALSMDPADLAAFVRSARVIDTARGTFGKERQACEADAAPIIRKGVVAARDLTPGTVLAKDDLMYARPATGFPAAKLDALVGRTVTAPVPFGAPLTPETVGD